jgi:hypothetical protein
MRQGENVSNSSGVASDAGRPPVQIRNDEGTSVVMAMSGMRRSGDQLVISGTLMGAWPSDMVVQPPDVARLVGLVLRSPSVIGYVLTLPTISRRWRRTHGAGASGRRP